MNRYYPLSDIFEETLCSPDLICPNGWETGSKLLESIVELEEAKSPGFAKKLRTVIRRNMWVRHRVKFVSVLVILYVLLEAFVTGTSLYCTPLEPILAKTLNDSHAPRAWWLSTQTYARIQW